MVNHLRNNILVAVVACLLSWAPFAGFGQTDVKEEAQAAKLTPDLLNLLQKEGLQQKNTNSKSRGLRQSASSPDSGVDINQDDLIQVKDGMVAIDAISNEADAQALLNALQDLGMTEGQYYRRIVSGYFPINKLNFLRDVATLHIARPGYKPLVHAGRVTSQGDVAMRSNVARQTYNVTGAGSKVGVLSDSYDALKGAAAGVASDDLPANVQVLKDITGAADEGRAMAEIIHDVAPGASIAFHTASVSYVDFANGIIRLAQAGCNIITDDIYYYYEPFFQDGILSQAINDVKKDYNVSYFSAAGNSGRQSYTSAFRNSGKLPAGLNYPAGSAAHDFGNGKITQKITIPVGGTLRYVLQWSDPFYSESIQLGGVSGAKTDIDILAYYNGIPYAVSGADNIGYDPYERIFLTNPYSFPLELEIAIIKYSGPDPTLIKWVNYGSTATIEFDTKSSTVVGHANAQGAIAVGAAIYAQTPAYNATQYPNGLTEYYSSAGGTPILFTEYGQPFPTRVRQKPDLVAPDGGNTTFFIANYDLDRDGFPNFTGTSAAAPHAAGVAALLQERSKNSMSADDVKKRLQTTAIDMDDPSTTGFDFGFDYGTGFGLIQADKALMVGQSLAILEPVYDCQTHKITLLTNGGDGTPITFTVPGVRRTQPISTTATATFFVGRTINYTTYTPASTTGIVEDGVVAEGKPIVITATQNGVTTTYTFDFVEYCSRPRAFTLVQPLYNCSTGAITFQTAGGDGTTITYTAPGVKRSSPTEPNGTIEAGLLYDPMPINIVAVQSGVAATYRFDFRAYCNSRARMAASEPGSGLQVSVLGNPIVSDWVSIEVRGAQGQPLKLQVNNTVGGLTSEQSVNMAADVEQHRVRLGQAPGLYLLQVTTPSQTKTVKVIRQ